MNLHKYMSIVSFYLSLFIFWCRSLRGDGREDQGRRVLSDDPCPGVKESPTERKFGKLPQSLSGPVRPPL